MATITLYVDSAHATSLTQQTVDTYCNFGQASNITNESYSVAANVGDTIEWVGQTNPASSNIINITKVKYENIAQSSNIFGGNGTIQGDNGSPEKVSATVQNGTDGEEETYQIFFNVNGGQQFNIDPKIIVNPTQS